MPEDEQLDRRDGGRRWAGAGRRSRGGALRAGRPGLLPVLGADERDPGAGGGGARGWSSCAPTPDGRANPLVLLAARLAGVETVYRIGGAQAIAALAYGTETIAPVDKITGPGNAYVAAAKRRVFGQVGIDMIAGPSEILVIADRRQRSRLDRARPAEPGRARRERAVDPDHRRRRASADARGRGGGARGSRRCERARHRRGELARLRRGHRRARPGRGGGAVRPHRARAPGALRRRPRGAGGRDPPRRRDLPRPLDARGDRRLRRRPEPRAAHGALGALLLGPVGAGFPQAHDAGPDDARGAAAHRPGGRAAGDGPKACRRTACPCAPGSTG